MKSTSKRATVYLDTAVHRAIKRKSIATASSISALINEALRQSLVEDAADLAAFKDRERETSIPLNIALRDLKRRGSI
jgi:hypothetical protein